MVFEPAVCIIASTLDRKDKDEKIIRSEKL